VKAQRLFVIGALSLLATLTFTGASANSLVATNPVGGSAVTTSPSAVTITTEVPLIDMGNSITVTDPSGSRVDDGTLAINGVNAVIGLKPLVTSGVYKVSYVLLAENDVPLEGSYTFNFSAPSVIETPAPSPSDSPAKVSGNNVVTGIFVIALLLVAIAVLIALSLYARKLYNER
jgi:methionine-rich copper-binding protein CopC